MWLRIGKRGKFQIVLVLLWILLVLLLASDRITLASTAEEAITMNIEEEKMEPARVLDADFLKLLEQGKMHGIPFGLGTAKDTILTEWGHPTRVQDNGSHELLFYEAQGCFFSIDVTSHQVIAIGSSRSQITMTPAEVKEIIGTPFTEEQDLMNGGWLMLYRAGMNEVYFNSEDKDSPITSWLLKAQ